MVNFIFYEEEGCTPDDSIKAKFSYSLIHQMTKFLPIHRVVSHCNEVERGNKREEIQV